MDKYDSYDLELDGFNFEVTVYYDTDHEPPWENSDGHGPVRASSRHREGSSDKKPGERPLNSAGWNDTQYYYDWAEACRMAKIDRWNTEPYDAPNRVERAVQADFDYLRGWLNDDWYYVGVEVKMLGPKDEDGKHPVIDEDTCWGVETHKDYHKEFAKESARGMIEAYRRKQAEHETEIEIALSNSD
jgi:hypothetical protein